MTKKYTKICPAFRKLAQSPRLSPQDITVLFGNHGMPVPYATMYGYIRKVTGFTPMGYGIPKTIEARAKTIWTTYEERNPDLFDKPKPTEDPVVASAGPEKEGPSQMDEWFRNHPLVTGVSEPLTEDDYVLAEKTTPVAQRDGYLELEMPNEDVMDLNSIVALLRMVAPGGIKSIRVEY